MNLSLKWKIQLWHALILGLVLGTLGTGFYFYERAYRLDAIDDQLDKLIHPMMGPLMGPQHGGPPSRREGPQHGGPPPRREEPQGPRGDRPDRAQSNIDQIFPTPDGWQPLESLLRPSTDRSAQNESEEGPGRPGEFKQLESIYVPKGFYARSERKDGLREPFQSSNFPEMEMPRQLGQGYYIRFRGAGARELYHETTRARVLVGQSLDPYYAGLTTLKLQIAGGSAAIFFVSMLVGHFLVSRSIRPLTLIEDTSEKIAQGQLSERIPEISKSGAMELKNLANHLNHTFNKLEESFKRQLQFTADASHELRTPLTALLAQIEHGLKKPRPGEQYSNILEVCKRSSTRIQRITEQLIELSRYDSGRVELDREEVSLAMILAPLAEELGPYVQEQGHQLEIDIGDGELTCDPFRLEQVITNLVNNAVQHNSQPMTITLCGVVKEDTCHIEVIDTGKGIQPENLDRLFDRFFQETSSRTKEKGSNNVGLGLAISEAIIKAHGGHIEVESTPGVETTFRIVLPLS